MPLLLMMHVAGRSISGNEGGHGVDCGNVRASINIFGGKTDAVPAIPGFAPHYGDILRAFVEISGMQAV